MKYSQNLCSDKIRFGFYTFPNVHGSNFVFYRNFGHPPSFLSEDWLKIMVFSDKIRILKIRYDKIRFRICTFLNLYDCNFVFPSKNQLK